MLRMTYSAVTHRIFTRTFPRTEKLLVCSYSSEQQRPSFVGNLIKNIKDEYSKNKEMHQNLKKFKEDTQKLEDSEALKAARKKFQQIEGFAAKEAKKTMSSVQISDMAKQFKNVVKESSQNETFTKIRDRVNQTSKQAAETVGETAKNIGKSDVFKAASSSATSLKSELESDSLGSKVYVAPKTLRKRSDGTLSKKSKANSEDIKPNDDATNVELHKDSVLFARWQKFRDDNAFVDSIIDMGTKVRESDNLLLRGVRMFGDKVSSTFGGTFKKTELSEVLTEICKLEPNFCKEHFLKRCERDIIPNILEAVAQGNLDVLKDWCHEGTFNILSHPIKEAKQQNVTFESKILDIENVDLVLGKMVEQGPVLVITFTTQEIHCIRKVKSGEVIFGNPEQVMRVFHVWVLCRDETEMDPDAAWRLLESKSSSQEQFL